MTRFAPLWQQAGSYAAQLDRGLIAALWPAGGVLGGAVAALNNTMTASVAPGSAAVPLASGQGAALCRWDAAEVVTVTASPPSGQSRIDLVVCQVRDNAIDAGPNNDFVFVVVAGTPAASAPAAPAVPANALAVAQVTVPGAAANLNGATITPRAGAMSGRVIGSRLVSGANYSAAPQNYTIVDAANMNISFVAGPSGRVLVELGAYLLGTVANQQIGFQWSTVPTSGAGLVGGGMQSGGLTSGKGATLRWIIQLTPGQAYTLYLQWAYLAAAGTIGIGAGATDVVITVTDLS